MAKYFDHCTFAAIQVYSVLDARIYLKNMLQLASFWGSLIRECFSYSKNWVEAWEQGYGRIWIWSLQGTKEQNKQRLQ